MPRRLPFTLVGGFSGAGKTSLLHHFISEHRGGYLAVLVEDSGPLNLDARQLRGLCGAMRRQHDVVREIPALDGEAQIVWLAKLFSELAGSGRFDRVLVEVAGTTSPARLARHFSAGPDQAGELAASAELRQVIVVVDALDFHRGAVVRPATGSLADLQRAQIESASLLVLNKCDLVGEPERNACLNLLGQINSSAALTETAYGELPAEAWNRPLIPPSLAARSPASASSPDLTGTLYRAWRPFHPGRFWDWFNAEHAGLLRLKGIVWLATRPLLVGGVSRTRWQNSCGGAGVWWAALPREEWPQEAAARERIQAVWREPHGDRRQELVLLGDAAEMAGRVRELDACLLRPDEMARPPREWLNFPDPFPAWDVEGES